MWFTRFILSLFNPKDNFIYNLPNNVSGAVWDRTYSKLDDYNKRITTLSSSALILSFTAVQIGKLHIDKLMLTLSWIFFVIVLIAGVLIYFFNYLYIIANELSKEKSGKVTKLEYALSNVGLYYFETRTTIYYLSFIQLLSFISAIILLMIVAYKII